MRALLISGLLLFSSVSVWAGGEKYHVSLMLSPSAEWMRFSNSINAKTYNALWGTKISQNFGFEYKRFFDPSLSLSFGAMYSNKGFRNEIFGTNDLGLPTQEVVGITLFSAHMVSIPLALNIHHRISRKLSLDFSLGASAGYIFSEIARNKYYSDETNPEQGFWDLSEGRSNINILQDWYAGAHAGVGVSVYVKSRMVLGIQPTYRMQLNNARDYLGSFSSSDPFVARLNSFGLDVKIGYFFSKQIKDRKDKF